MGTSKIIMRKGRYFCHKIVDFSDMEWTKTYALENITVYYPDSSLLCSIVKGTGTYSSGDDQFEIWFVDEKEPRPRVHTNLIMKEIEDKYLNWYEKNNEFETISNGNDKHRG